MRKKVYLSQLEEFTILWLGDVHALAEFILCSYDAMDREVNASNQSSIQRSRPTLHGLAADFAMLTKVPRSRVEKEFQAFGFRTPYYIFAFALWHRRDAAREEPCTTDCEDNRVSDRRHVIRHVKARIVARIGRSAE
jgi:hypothetical protein